MKNDITLLDLYPVIKETLAKDLTYSFVPSGNSMYPLFNSDKVEVTLQKADKISVGDIVLVKTKEDNFILHRVDLLTSEGCILRGDNMLTREGPFGDDCVIGKVVSYNKNGKEKYFKGFGYCFYLKVILPIHRYKMRIIKKIKGR